MQELYAIYSSRGLWIEVVKARSGGFKRVILGGKAEMEKRAKALSREHKRAYWVCTVKVPTSQPKP